MLRFSRSPDSQPFDDVQSDLARTPPGLRIYAIGDIHGMAELATQMFALIDAETASWHGEVIVVVLGDYIDRGPHTKEVLEFLAQRSQLQGSSLVTLRGNHEDLFLRFLDDPVSFGSDWLQLGGGATLLSYGVNVSRGLDYRAIRSELIRHLPINHLAFLQALPLTFQHQDFFFSHAGARPGVALLNQTERDLLWTRWRHSDADVSFEKILIHGHTPVEEPTARGGRINVDTGAYATGRLSAVRITPDGIGFVTVTAAMQSLKIKFSGVLG